MSQQRNREVEKRYVLGTLSEQERDRLEQQYFSDDDAFEEVEIAEDDLVDQYVGGELTSTDRTLFERALSGSPQLQERIEFSRLLRDKTSGTAASIPASEVARGWFFWPQKRTSLAFAFAVLLVLVGGLAVATAWLKLRQQSASVAAREAELRQRSEELAKLQAETRANNEQWTSRLQEQQAQLEAERQAIQKEIEKSGRSPDTLPAFLYLRLGALRSPGKLPEATLNQNKPTLTLQLELLDTDYSRYRAVVLKPDLQPVSGSPSTLKPRKTRSGSFLFLPVPKDISPGHYFVRVEGLAPSGEPQPIGDYPFRLNREQ